MVPKGGIIEWAGAIVDIPTGYQLCDGTNGTPDLRDQFIVGAGSTYVPGATGGTLTHTHPFTGDGHGHPPQGGVQVPGTGAFEAWPVGLDAGDRAAAGTTDASGTLPPYFALAKIQRMV